VLVRGKDECNHFDLRPPPASDFAPEAQALHALEITIMAHNYLQQQTQEDSKGYQEDR
jgi:hypothetical protein